jgi:tetratricopeptide (TPR) repeat protein
MKNILAISNRLAWFVWVVFLVGPVAAQSQSPQALTWFKVGLTEKDPQAKITAYMKALEYDPQFVEAFYNLGLTFKKQQDYRRAEQYLLKAYSVKPEKITNDNKVQILYELATTYKKLGKAKEAKETFSSLKGIAANPAIKSTIALELGRGLYEEGRYQEALIELQAGRQTAGTNQEQFTNLIQLAESGMELKRLYEAAEKSQASGNLRGAKALFEQIKARNPEYKNVAVRIATLDSLFAAETAKTNLASLYDQAVKQTAAGDLEAALAGFENLLQQDGNYKDVKIRLEAVRQQLAQKQRSGKLEKDYAAGMAALKAGNWTDAILAFEAVLATDRNFREARNRLREAQNGLARENTETVVARYYADGIAAMNKSDWVRALTAFEKVRKIEANYRQVTSLLAEVEAALQKRAVAAPSPVVLSKAAPAASPAGIDSLYQLGVTAAKAEDWLQAVVNFEKVRMLQTDYNDVTDRLAEARANLALATNGEKAAPSGNISTLVGGAAALLVLPLLGFAMFSPAARARFQLFRGNYLAAAQIYEKALTRQPKKLKLYPALANVYLILGRNDENAMKVYKTILQLNLNTRNRDEMSTIVAQNYLTEGRTDSDAIEVLESALKAEQRRQRHG